MQDLLVRMDANEEMKETSMAKLESRIDREDLKRVMKEK
jgi:hypothetical protein